MAIRVLVVDDDPGILDMSRLMLEKNGYEVMTASNGMIALEEIKKQRPDLILADVLMPEMDGYTFYKELKKNPGSADIPVLIITARGKMEDSFKVVGVDGFVTKPVLPEELLAEMDHILRIAEIRRESVSEDKQTARKRILAVGPQNIVLESMACQGQRAGYTVATASSGADGIAQAVKFLPHIIFVDVLLNDMSAGEWIDTLRRLPQFEQRPIIGYSYYETDKLSEHHVRQAVLSINESSKRIMQCGATRYMGRYSHPLFIKTILEYVDSNP